MSFNDNALRIGTQPLSYSKLEVAKTCGYQFTKKYIERVKPVDLVSSSAAAVGTAVHLILELCLKKYMHATEMPDLAEISASVNTYFVEVTTLSPLSSSESDDISLLLGNTQTLLVRLLEYIITHKCKIFIEEELAVDQFLNPMSFGDPKAFFRGKIDLIIVAPSGAVTVVDHKTNRVNEYQTRESILAKHADQLRAYEILVFFGMAKKLRDEFGIDIKAIQTSLAYVVLADILRNPRPTNLTGLKTLNAEWFVDWVNKLSDRAVEGKVNRDRHCDWCGYKSLCGSKRGLKKKQKQIEV